MTFLLDTNAVSDLMRGSPEMEAWISNLDAGDRLITCAVVRGEILFGIERLPLGSRRGELEALAHHFLGAGDEYATTKAARLKRGLALDENDLWVAATALALGATLVSRDADFAGIEGLNVVAPGKR